MAQAPDAPPTAAPTIDELIAAVDQEVRAAIDDVDRTLIARRCSRYAATRASSSRRRGCRCGASRRPVTTQDLDIVHQRTPANVARLLKVLLQLDATMRYDFARRGLRPTAEMLAGRGQINISTTLGPIDPLCELDAGQGYDELLAHSESIVDEGADCACSICRR